MYMYILSLNFHGLRYSFHEQTLLQVILYFKLYASFDIYPVVKYIDFINCNSNNNIMLFITITKKFNSKYMYVYLQLYENA